MPSYELNDDQRILLEHADRFARDTFLPIAEEMDTNESWPDDLFAKIGAQGYLGVTVAEEYGGAGLDLVSAGVILQAFSRYSHAIGLSVLAHDNLCTNNIYRNGTDEQRRKYLPKLCSGEWVGALGMTEPGAGSDAVRGMASRAQRVGDEYIINGRKIFITNGPIADVILMYAKTDLDLGPRGITAFIVEKDAPGYSVAQKMIKMGFRGSQTGELVFDDCRVPAENVVGGENAGVAVMMGGLDLERAMIAPIAVGIGERALQLSIEYSKVREQFGKPISEFQMIQGKLADMYTELEVMRTFVYRALSAANEVEVGGGGRGEIHKLTAAAALFAGESVNRILDNALQIHGGFGYIWESEINRLYRSIKLLEIGAGTSEVRRNIIAEELLR
ncbi:MAG: acyl-CoA dehydrogenase [Candidatus Hydrogenedentota bacterium]|nr:MAG: acyl-CoA dehydrogenase [Candidatus Hydrogenedentota bacterium]